MHSSVSFDKHLIHTHTHDTSTWIKMVVSILTKISITPEPSLLSFFNKYLPFFDFYHYRLVLLVLELYINRSYTMIFIFHIYILWLGSLLNIMFFRFIYVVTLLVAHSFFLSLSSIPLYEYTTICPSVGRHLGYFGLGLLWIKLLWTVNILV